MLGESGGDDECTCDVFDVDEVVLSAFASKNAGKSYLLALMQWRFRGSKRGKERQGAQRHLGRTLQAPAASANQRLCGRTPRGGPRRGDLLDGTHFVHVARRYLHFLALGITSTRT